MADRIQVISREAITQLDTVETVMMLTGGKPLHSLETSGASTRDVHAILMVWFSKVRLSLVPANIVLLTGVRQSAILVPCKEHVASSVIRTDT